MTVCYKNTIISGLAVTVIFTVVWITFVTTYAFTHNSVIPKCCTPYICYYVEVSPAVYKIIPINCNETCDCRRHARFDVTPQNDTICYNDQYVSCPYLIECTNNISVNQVYYDITIGVPLWCGIASSTFIIFFVVLICISKWSEGYNEIN